MKKKKRSQKMSTFFFVYSEAPPGVVEEICGRGGCKIYAEAAVGAGWSIRGLAGRAVSRK